MKNDNMVDLSSHQYDATSLNTYHLSNKQYNGWPVSQQSNATTLLTYHLSNKW